MFEKDQEIVNILQKENKRFSSLFEKHHQLHKQIEAEQKNLSDFDLEKLKKEKLKAKDELQSIIHTYKVNN